MIILPVGDINPRKSIPYINYTLIGLNVLIFIFLGFKPNYPEIVATYGLIPADLEPLDFLTAMFLHGSIWHLLGNMLYLWICGDNVEDRLGHFGFLVLYLISGITAAFAHIIMSQGNLHTMQTPCIGASGAIAGVLGAYAVLFPKSKIKFLLIFWLLFFIFIRAVHIASAWAIGFWFVQQLLLSYLEKIYQIPQGVAYWAHIGGFLLGLVSVGLLRFFGLVRGGLRRY